MGAVVASKLASNEADRNPPESKLAPSKSKMSPESTPVEPKTGGCSMSLHDVIYSACWRDVAYLVKFVDTVIGADIEVLGTTATSAATSGAYRTGTISDDIVVGVSGFAGGFEEGFVKI